MTTSETATKPLNILWSILDLRFACCQQLESSSCHVDVSIFLAQRERQMDLMIMYFKHIDFGGEKELQEKYTVYLQSTN